MGKKTHGPYLISAIEKNDHQKVHELLSKEIRNKEKIREICTASLKRLASEHYEVPLLLAAQLPDPSIIQYMVGNHHVDINFVLKEQVGRKPKVKSALILAVRRGLYDTVEAILAMNADPNIQDHKGRSALHHAVRKADYRMAKMLVVRGAQASLTDKGDNTPLHVASIFGHVELAKMLIYYGADLYKKGQLGAIPIHIAAKEGHVGLLKLFCQHDVNPNIKMPCYDGREKAALHVAAEEGHFECVIALVELGADINLGDSEGETPLHCSVLHEYDPMGMKSKEDYTETTKWIIKSGANVNNQNGRGETALHLAARNQFQKSVEVLLQAGADPLMEDNSGDKPLDLVDEEDAVSRQIIKQVMENRETYMNDLFELKAKGYSTSLNPLHSKAMSMDMLSSKESILGKAASTLGLVQPYPRTSTNSMPEDEYLQPIGSRHNYSAQNITAEIHPSASGSSDTTEGAHKSPDSTYAKIDENQQNGKPLPDLKKGKEAMIPKFLKGKQSQESLLERKANMLESSDSSHYDDEGKLKNTPNKIPKVANGVMKIEAVRRTDSNSGRSLPSPPPSTVRDSILSTSTDMTDMSSVWELTPHASTSGGRGQRDFGVSKTTGDLMTKLKQSLAAREREYSEYATTQYEALPDDATNRQLKGLSTFAPDPKVQAEQPKKVQQAPTSGTKMVYAPDETHSDSDDDDTFFDDESFDTMDTMSEATVEMADKQKQKVMTANKELNAAGQVTKAPKEGDSHMQNWLSEQATLLIKRNFAKEGGPIAQSTPPVSRVNYSTNTIDSPSDVYENFTSVSEQAAMLHKASSKHPRTGRPVPPPRPPKKLERNPSTSSADSIKRTLPPEPKPKKVRKKGDKIQAVDSDVNLVKLEVDEKEPGQTVIRILPVAQKPATPKKPKLHTGSDGSKVGKLNADNVSNLLISSGSKRQSSFDADSQVSSFSKTSSKIKRKPSQRFVIERPGVQKLHNHQNNGNTFVPLSKRQHNTSEEQDSMEQESIFIDETDDEEEPNTGHYTAICFEHVKQDDFDQHDETVEELPSAPSTPKIKMTFQSKEPPVVHDVQGAHPQPKVRQEIAPLVVKQHQASETPHVKPASKPEIIIKPELKQQSKSLTKPPVSTKPDIRPNIRPKPLPRNITPVLKLEDAREDGISPIPKPRVQKESTSQSTSQETLQSLNHDSHSESGQEQDVKKITPVPIKDTTPEPVSKKTKSKKASPPGQTEEEPLPNINNNIEEKIAPTKKKVKKKGTKSKTSKEKKASKTATIKIEKVEKSKVEEEIPKVEVATKPDAVHYAVVNKEGKHKSKLIPIATEDSDTSSNSQDSKEPPLPPIKLIDPYADSNHSIKAPTIVKLEDPYASVSVVDEIITNKVEEPLPVVTQSQPHLEYEELPAFRPTAQKPPEPISQLNESPKARKVTIGSKQFIPNNKKRPKDHDHRRVVYVCGGEIDFDIIGGNADGVFIYNLQQGSNGENAGLRVGDKLLKINEESVLSKTKEDVYLILKSIKNVLDLVVRHRYDSYKALIDSGGLGDSFHIRSHLNHKASRNGEMNICQGDLFLIQDTLPNGQYGSWRASKLNAGPREQQHGLIPNLQKAEQIGLDARMSQLKELEKEKGGFLKRGFKRSKSLDRSAMKLAKSQEDLSLNSRNKIAYEKVEHKAADFPRPVFLLGLFCDVVRDMLARECPGIFHIPNGDIEVPTTNASGTLDPIDTTVLKNIVASGKHCLTIISPKGIEFLQNTDFNPTVIYLSPGHKSILKTVKNKLAPTYDKKIGYLYDESMAFERQYDHLFTATVSYTSDDSWFPLLKDTIHRIQNQPQWQTVKENAKPRVDSSDEESEDESKLMNRSLDNIPTQIEHSLPITGINNKNIHGIMKKQDESPSSERSITSSVSSLPKKSILKKDRSFSTNSPQVSDTESSGSSVTRQHVNNTAPNNIGQFIAPPNQYHQKPTNQYHQAPSNQYHQPTPGNQHHEPVNQPYQPPNQYHPQRQPPNQYHPPTQQYQQHPPPAQRNVQKPASESGPAMLGFHPALSSMTAQSFNPPAQTAGGHSGKETVL